MALEATMRAMRDAGVTGVAVVSRDGTVLGSDLPPGVSKETFSIMCATIHGAGMTVSNELKRPAPKTILLESNDGSIVIAEAGRRALVVCVLPRAFPWSDASVHLAPLLEAIGRETG